MKRKLTRPMTYLRSLICTYEEGGDGIGKESRSERKANAVTDLIKAIFCGGEKILIEVDPN